MIPTNDPPQPIRIHPDILGRFPEVEVLTTRVHSVRAQKKARFVKARRKRIAKTLTSSFPDSGAVHSHPLIAAYRDLSWQIGVDPDETPPSTQALTLRYLAQKQFPNINSIVDCLNLAAVETLIPLGAFDLDRIKGEIELRFSHQGELFLELGQREAVPLDAGRIVLADSEKVLSVFCWRDSEWQKISESTENVLLLACRAPGVSRETVIAALDSAVELLGMAHPTAVEIASRSEWAPAGASPPW